ncbi:hypothetical protein B0O99DRAFT_642102 [Bisporella sp. PMI_857]|nr:hypothetical protein B0O99DRAFT_642102 [Bisporella sp. PMI_857]
MTLSKQTSHGTHMLIPVGNRHIQFRSSYVSFLTGAAREHMTRVICAIRLSGKLQ